MFFEFFLRFSGLTSCLYFSFVFPTHVLLRLLLLLVSLYRLCMYVFISIFRLPPPLHLLFTHPLSHPSRQCSTSVHDGSETPAPHNYETTFDVHGNVETRSTSSQGNREDTRSQRSIESNRDTQNRYTQFLFLPS